MNKRAYRLGGAALLATAIVIAGCGATDINNTQVQRLVQTTLRPAPSVVSCPSGLHPTTGATFICQLRYADGDVGQLTVHELDAAGHVQTSPGDLKILTIGQKHAKRAVLKLVRKNHVGLRSITCPANTPAAAGALACQVIDIHGLHAAVTEHIGPGGALTINPATDLQIQGNVTRAPAR
jgi:hypothetical protein